MDWINFLLFWLPTSLIGLVLLRLIFVELLAGEMRDNTAKKGLIVVVLIILAEISAKTIWLYFELQRSDFGKYFLSANNNYFRRAVWYMIQPEVWAFGIALGFLIVLWLIRKTLKSPMFNRADTMIILLTILVVGPSNILVLLIGSFSLMLLSHLFLGIYHKNFKGRRLRLSPFLLVLSLAIVILGNFNFYQKFLAFFRLL